jgi:3-deoxy-D-manno-octulosonate 8-phosphate phosphatase (KDO 8-P phosphatase)
LKHENFCFIGDDVYDMLLLDKIAFSCAPPESVAEVLEAVHYVTKAGAGRGCVREVIDFILRKQGKIR